MTPVPYPGAPGCTGITPPLPVGDGGAIGIAPVDSGSRCIGSGWATWSHGYTGDVYFTGGATSQVLTLPSGTKAVYFYVEPNPFSVQTFEAIAQPGDVSTGVFSADGSGGATYVGFYATGGDTIQGITINCSTDFATGEFGWNGGGTADCTCDPDASWMSVSPTGGTVAPGGSMAVTVSFDTTGMSEGTYNGNIKIASNDPDEGCVVVPVTLNVTTAGDCVEDDSGALDIVGAASGPGGTVTIPVRIQSAPNDVASLGFEVAFPDWILTYTGFAKGPLVEGFDFFNCVVPADKPYVVRCGGFEAGADIVATGASGDVVYLDFNISPDCDSISKLDLQALKDDIGDWSASHGCFDCTVCSCDINGDGEVTPQDAMCAFQKYLGICPTACGPCEEICCDVTQDADCTPADALEIFKEYLGLPSVCS